jgi:ATP-dependent Lhr-like helicase
LVAAALEAARDGGHRQPSERELLDALWDLVWAGEVTNDTFAPLRALRWPRRGGSRRSGPPRGRVGTRMGPPEAGGRWSLVTDALRMTSVARDGAAPSATERRAALAATLLERHGVVTRDAVAAEGVRGGFGAVYPVYREMEERGQVRRGYFVEGLGGAQFALSGAVERLRAMRRPAGGEPGGIGTILLAAADPANPYGAALPWPGRDGSRGRSPSRVAGAYVVLHDGELALYLERGGRSLQTFEPFALPEVADAAVDALRRLVVDGRLRRLQLERIDGVAIDESSLRTRLAELGFRQAYKGYVLGPAAGPGRS